MLDPELWGTVITALTDTQTFTVTLADSTTADEADLTAAGDAVVEVLGGAAVTPGAQATTVTPTSGDPVVVVVDGPAEDG